MKNALRITAADGYGLVGHVMGASHRGPVLVINGATGVRQWYYARFAAWAAGQGATVLTWDYRGIGESRPHRLRGFPGTMRDWGHHDLEGVLRFASAEWSGRPLVTIGHSVGGQILGQPASNGLISRAVTIGSQFGSWQLWPAPRKWAFAALWHGLMPGLTHTLGYFPGSLGIGADLPKEVALEWARWCRSRDFFLAHGVARDGYARLKIPILSFSFADDTYAPKAAVDALHSLYVNAKVERLHLAPRDVGAKELGHFGFFKEGFRETLWKRLGEFVFDAPAVRYGPSDGAHPEGSAAHV